MSSDRRVEAVREPPRSSTFVEPVSPDGRPELARSNMRLALALWGISLLLFAGTVAIALVYLALE